MALAVTSAPPWALILLDGEKGAKGSADQPESYIPARHNAPKLQFSSVQSLSRVQLFATP